MNTDGHGYAPATRSTKRSRFVLTLGVALFVLSFFAPWPELNVRPVEWNFCWGFCACFLAFVTLVRGFAEPFDWPTTVGLLGLGIAWSANLSVLVRFPRWLLPLPILAPWAIALFYWLLLDNTTGFLSFPLFYPWALGIALIHDSRYFETQAAKPKAQTT